MIPNSFEYKRAQSISEAISMLDEDAQILGGGHSLIPAMKLRLNSPGTLIDISKISSLKEIKDNDKSVSIGAGVTHAAIASSSLLAEHVPMFVQAAVGIGDIQVRNVGTIGGSMAHADPSADWPAALLASNASVVIQNAQGTREVDIDQFFTGFFETALEEGEVITVIRVPKTGFNRKSAYAKFKQPASRFALVGCAAAIELKGGTVDEARIGITGVSDNAYRATAIENALKGKVFNAESIASAIVNPVEGMHVMSDHYASEKYRTHLAKVYVKRVLQSLL